MREALIFNFCLALCIGILFAGCDQTFQPLKQNDAYHFSIYGYLNASADTQWIRVGTIRQNINEAPDPKAIQVTLEDLNSGKAVTMNDSLFEAKEFLNYWTTMEIKNERTYRITAEGTNGEASRVSVTTPKKLSSIYITINDGGYGSSAGANIYIDDAIEHIADVQSVWYVLLKSGTENHRRIFRFPIRNTLERTSAFFGGYYAFANWDRELAHIEQSIAGTEIVGTSKQFFIAAGGPEWIEGLSSVDDLEYFLDGEASNVENGLGYAVGIDGQWFKQKYCLTDDKSGYAPCTPDEGPFWY